MRHPDCPCDPSECRITPRGTSIVEEIEWTPTYDGNGVAVDANPNTYATRMHCDTCNASWTIERTADQSVVVHATVPQAPAPQPKDDSP